LHIFTDLLYSFRCGKMTLSDDRSVYLDKEPGKVSFVPTF